MYPNKNESIMKSIWSHVLSRNRIAYLTKTFRILGKAIVPMTIPSFIKIDMTMIIANKRLSVGNLSRRCTDTPNYAIWYMVITRRDTIISKAELTRQE